MRPNPDASPRRTGETTDEHLLRTGVLSGLVTLADVVAAVPVEKPVPAGVVVEILGGGPSVYQVTARVWVDEDGRVQVDDEREERFVRTFRVPSDLRSAGWKVIDHEAGLPFVFALAEWFALRPNPYWPVRLLVDGRPVTLTTGRPPRLLPRVEPQLRLFGD